MTIDWLHFTPWASLAGGILIGLATALLLLANGRVAGISGILGGLLRPSRGDIAWRVTFILGLFVAPLVWLTMRAMPPAQIDHSPALLTIGGLLVGIGTRFGNGCTSGHGVCGIARLSPRSLLATACFLAAGFVTVFIVRHVLGR
ncbi:YeeE/YedE family protein [Telluria mixta]|uniref:YeeE/YedE family protein n=1 Tax=Telluria mixta TaxID=34071 RepID=A0ABT2C4P2_9BURK|nr:YeeE/YedE family protein [Telluria mixta]MCS0632360.1 YeeE/YedE family protein [Telluria mixta]WEM94885.1 YeeE/YedE family protein [Telluria mixta]